ncbi:hypothetical protein AKJ16_DCAP12566 [Drosera capensis]
MLPRIFIITRTPFATRRDSCQRCGEPRPGDRADLYGAFSGRGRAAVNAIGGGSSSFVGGFGGSTGPDVRPGDWYCTVGNCGTHNFASRSSCFKCGAYKEEFAGGGLNDFSSMRGGFGFGGGSGAGGSNRAGWKSGDWICTR